MRGGSDNSVESVNEVGLACTNVLAAFSALGFAFWVRAFSRTYEPGLLYVDVIYSFKIDVYLDYFGSYRWRELTFSRV